MNPAMWLRNHATLDEKWVQDRIAEDPTILGLGDVVLKDRERRQPHAGRLDLHGLPSSGPGPTDGGSLRPPRPSRIRFTHSSYTPPPIGVNGRFRIYWQDTNSPLRPAPDAGD